MSENNTPVIPETPVKPPDSAPVKGKPSPETLLLMARCDEKEEKYEDARDLFIELNQTDEGKNK